MSTPQSQNYSNLRVDLHSHTSCSDGALTPSALIDRATNLHIDVLAITDHDTVAGLESARAHIKQNELAITLINGIEISTAWEGFEIHIVGLNVDDKNPDLQALIAQQQQARQLRASRIGEKLEKCGFPDITKQALALAGDGSITRAHFARVLVGQGHVTKLQAAFDKYIGKGKRAYVKPTWCDIKQAVDVIHGANGVAVMAHPVRYDLSGKWLRRLVLDFKQSGGDGLEIVLPQMNPAQRNLMLSYCAEYELHASMGSDFHQPSRWSDLGRNLRMPENCHPIWRLWQ